MPRAKTAAEWGKLVPSGVAANWSSPNPSHHLNTHPHNQTNLKHPANLVDHGFNHLNLPTPSVPQFYDIPSTHGPTFSDAADESRYLNTVQKKLEMAKLFILKEVELGLDPKRRMDKDPTTVALTQPPIVFTNYSHKLIRDLVKLRIELERLRKLGKDGDTKEVQDAIAPYQWAWKEMRSILISLVPGNDVKIRHDRAENMMFEVLGKMFDEVQEGEDGV